MQPPDPNADRAPAFVLMRRSQPRRRGMRMTVAALLACLIASGAADARRPRALTGASPEQRRDAVERRDPPVNTALPSPSHLAPAPPAESRGPSADRPAAIPPINDDGTIPAVALAAYQRTAADQALNDPQCHLPWALLAAIGKVESNHADGGRFDPDGTTTSHIVGPEFDVDDAADPGSSTPGHPVRQRAIGPMQLLPTIWKRWAAAPTAGFGPDPDNIFDAASATAAYLCSGGRDLSSPQQLSDAILLYNRSNTYLRSVLTWIRRYSETDHRIDVDRWLALSPADRSVPVRVSLQQ